MATGNIASFILEISSVPQTRITACATILLLLFSGQAADGDAFRGAPRGELDARVPVRWRRWRACLSADISAAHTGLLLGSLCRFACRASHDHTSILSSQLSFIDFLVTLIC